MPASCAQMVASSWKGLQALGSGAAVEAVVELQALEREQVGMKPMACRVTVVGCVWVVEWGIEGVCVTKSTVCSNSTTYVSKRCPVFTENHSTHFAQRGEVGLRHCVGQREGGAVA